MDKTDDFEYNIAFFFEECIANKKLIYTFAVD